MDGIRQCYVPNGWRFLSSEQLKKVLKLSVCLFLFGLPVWVTFFIVVVSSSHPHPREYCLPQAQSAVCGPGINV